MHTRLTPLTSALRLALLGLALTATSQPLLAAAGDNATQQQTRSYHIPAGSLDSVLGAFGQQAGVMIGVDSTLTVGQRSDGLNGDYSVQDGLQRILGTTRLEAVSDGAGFRLVPRAEGGVLELSATSISGQGIGEMTENSGSYTTGLVSIGSKTPVSLKDTPQSVSVITQRMVEDK